MGSRSPLYPSKLTDSLWFGEWFLSALSWNPLQTMEERPKPLHNEAIVCRHQASPKRNGLGLPYLGFITETGYRSGIQNQPFGIQTVIQKELSAGPGRIPGMLWRSTGPFCLDQFRHDLLVIFLGTIAGLKWLRSAEADLSFLRRMDYSHSHKFPCSLPRRESEFSRRILSFGS